MDNLLKLVGRPRDSALVHFTLGNELLKAYPSRCGQEESLLSVKPT
ncbi:MAG: hypothetical protein WBX11_01310 [Thiobacillaceae bacterium]